MKKKLIIFVFLINYFFVYCQIKESTYNIFSITYNTFNSGLNDSFYTNSRGDIVNFTKYFSKKRLISDKVDSLTLKMLDTIDNKYIYYLKDVSIKDTINGEYKPLKQKILSRINPTGYKKIIFKKFTSFETNFECFDKLYENVKVIKSFDGTFAVVQFKGKKYRLLQFNENCEIVSQDYFSVEKTEFYEDKNFLILKEKNRIIFVFDKYIHR